MDEEGPLRAQLHGRGAVDQLAGLGAAHLEEHAEFEFLESASLEGPLQVRQRIAPDEHMDADRRTVLEERHQVLRGGCLLFTAERGVAEVGLVSTQFAEAGQVADDHVDGLAVEHLLVDAPPHLVGEMLDRVAHPEAAHQFGLVRQRRREACQQDVGLLLGDRRLEHDEPRRSAERTARMRVVRGSQAHHRHRQEAHAQILALADHEQVGAALTAEDGSRRILDGDGVAQPRQRDCLWLASHRTGAEEFGQQGIASGIGRLVAVEDHAGQCRNIGASVGHAPQGAKVSLPALVVQKHDLKRIVAGDHAVGVVVDRLAWAGQQTGGCVVFAKDQAGIGLVALQRDADGHLPHRRAGQTVGAAERLGAEQHVHAEGSALTDEAVEDQGGILGDLVVLDEDLLKLVDDQQDARHRFAVP